MLELNRGSIYEESNGSFEGASEDSLVLVAQTGSHAAFQELRKRHAQKLLPRIYRITRNWEDAEDVLQESFLKAFVNIASFERRSSFASWLTRIAINSALMMLRKRRAIEISMDGMGNDEETATHWEPADSRSNPEEEYRHREAERLFLKAVDRLGPQLRQTILMKQVEDYSTKEVAAALGISVSAAKSRISRARDCLRTSMVWAGCRPPSARAKQASANLSRE